MAVKKPKQPKTEPILPAKYGTLSEEEILALAKQIEARDKQPLEKMPINSPEQARSYLVECGYDNLPPAKPSFG
jgi:hypothetical protein